MQSILVGFLYIWVGYYVIVFCCVREDIMALKGDKEKILELIAQIPQQMEAADIHDFCSLAVLYSAQTPYSFKRVSNCLTSGL